MLEQLMERLPSKIDGLLISSDVNRLFLTGFRSSDGYLLVTAGGSVFLTDSRYIEEARRVVKCCEVREFTSFSAQMPELCREFGCRKLGVESERLTVGSLKAFRRELTGVSVTTVGTDRLINSLRSVKTRGQVENILAAQSIAERAFEHIKGFIRPGVTEKEIALELDFFMLSHGAEALSFETIAVSGANTSKPHGVPTDKRVEYGDFVTMDYGAVFNGYHSDMTRTVAVGAVTDEQARVYETVLRAQLAALEVLRPGLLCSEADAAARSVIADAGCGEFFRHSTGHGVGIEIHENPYLSPKSKQRLSRGNVVTVEPGIYIPGKFGVRIEDMALITETGCENLTKSEKTLVIL